MARKPKMLITGAAGFIGRAACEHYRDLYEITAVDDRSRSTSDRHMPLGVEFVLSDAWRAAQGRGGFEAVIHLAAQVSVVSSLADPLNDFRRNAELTMKLAQWASQEKVGKFIYSSTNKVFGDLAGVRYPILDKHPIDPQTPYGISKATGALYVREFLPNSGYSFHQSCLAGNQPVLTPFGNKRIDEIQAGDMVFTGEKWAAVKKCWRSGIKPVREIRTENGAFVFATVDHRMVRPNGLRSNEAFGFGDLLSVNPEACYAPDWHIPNHCVLEASPFLGKVRSRTSDKRCLNAAQRIADSLLPLRGDRMLMAAEMVGRLFGDGNLTIAKRKGRPLAGYIVQHYGFEDELVEVGHLLRRMGLRHENQRLSYSRSVLPNGHVIEGECRHIAQQDLPTFTLFEMLGVPCGDKAREEYEVPAWIDSGDHLVKRAFLRGFLGAELNLGYVESSILPSFAQSKDIRNMESGRRFIGQLRSMLLGFGIETSCFESKPTQYKKGATVQITVRMRGGSGVFCNLASIGFSCAPRKSAKLNYMVRWIWERALRSKCDGIAAWRVAGGSVFWDSISQIVQTPVDVPVYDLEVEDDSHLFIAGGVQVSNCIFGEDQTGTEDQGWIGFLRRQIRYGRPIICYGDGRQIRDLLHVSDLLAAYDMALRDDLPPGSYGVGGGRSNAVNFASAVALLGGEISHYDKPRPHDQQQCIMASDGLRLAGWEPKVRALEWLQKERALLATA